MNVYVLLDPNDGVARYVGLTSKDVKHRLQMHIKEAKTKLRYGRYISTKERWILSLLSNNQIPTIQCMVENISKEVGIMVEQNIIAIYRRLCDGGTLLNVQKGGSYDSDKATPWNRGLTECYSDEFIENMKRSQSNRKDIYRFDIAGNFIDSWISTRTMCEKLGFDRRAVQRCLNKRPNFISHKGFMFSYDRNDIPCYKNKSVTHGKYSKLWQNQRN